MSQGFKTRTGWTTRESPSPVPVPPPAPSWVWLIVMCIAILLIGLLTYLEFK